MTAIKSINKTSKSALNFAVANTGRRNKITLFILRFMWSVTHLLGQMQKAPDHQKVQAK